MAQGTFGAQFLDQGLSLGKDFGIDLALEETLPTTRNLLFGEHSGRLQKDLGRKNTLIVLGLCPFFNRQPKRRQIGNPTRAGDDAGGWIRFSWRQAAKSR